MPTPTLAELARAGRLGAATAPLTDATMPVPVPPEITLAMLARAGLLGPAGGQYTTPGQAPPLTVAAGMPREELTNASGGLPSGDIPPPETPPPMPANLDRDRSAPPGPTGPSVGSQLAGMLTGFMTPLGLGPDATVMNSPGQTMTGQVRPPHPTRLSWREEVPGRTRQGRKMRAGYWRWPDQLGAWPGA